MCDTFELTTYIHVVCYKCAVLLTSCVDSLNVHVTVLSNDRQTYGFLFFSL
jgi:hypothetical protein